MDRGRGAKDGRVASVHRRGGRHRHGSLSRLPPSAMAFASVPLWVFPTSHSQRYLDSWRVLTGTNSSVQSWHSRFLSFFFISSSSGFTCNARCTPGIERLCTTELLWLWLHFSSSVRFHTSHFRTLLPCW